MKTLLNRRIVVGLSGGIACYKACDLVSRLVRHGAKVRVVMTANAQQFVTPLTLRTLSGNPVYTDTFQPVDPGGIDHVRLADFAEILVILPATADILAKMAHGLADDLLSTAYVASDCPVLAVVAMNTRMYEHPATRDNLYLLEKRGVQLLHPETGHLACGAEGVGRLPGRDRIIEKIVQILGGSNRLAGRKVLVTAGPTREALDPVRFLTNRSTGRMGFAVARAAVRMGAAEVHLVSGPSELATPLGVDRHDVVSALEMFESVKSLAGSVDLTVMTAAVSDYTLPVPSLSKIKKSDREQGLTLCLAQTPDILAFASQNRKRGAVVVGFAVETEKEVESAEKKLKRKGLDLIAVNNPLEEGAGFGFDTNRVTVIDAAGRRTDLPLMEKDEVAERLLEMAAEKLENPLIQV
jgi:phosphopantothenoylcysteine decarboxylase / phosphopantothenate---cysteine ligase